MQIVHVPGSWWRDSACLKLINNILDILWCKVLLE